MPAELAQAHRCFIYPQTRREPNWKFEQHGGKQINFAVDAYLRFDNSEVILEALIQGAGALKRANIVD